jgi:RHS repeat-associated protein
MDVALLASDVQASVRSLISLEGQQVRSYTPYGYRAGQPGSPAFCGQLPEAVGGYLLGNGYRMFNPALMRFHSPDSWSPFAEGGINAYGYGACDPINWVDPTGHSLKRVLSKFNPKFYDASATISKLKQTVELVGPLNRPDLKELRGLIDQGYRTSGKQLQKAKVSDLFLDKGRSAAFVALRDVIPEQYSQDRELVKEAVKKHSADLAQLMTMDKQLQARGLEESSRFNILSESDGRFRLEELSQS